MALTELQIRRFVRHILLPEVGGVGQERLLATEVHLEGEAEWVELAAAYLAAAGVTCDAHSGAGLELRIEPPIGDGTLGVTVSARAKTVVVRASACAQCRGASSGPLPAGLGRLAATLAASEVLRLALGLGDAEREWQLEGLNISAFPPGRCDRHRASSEPRP